MPPAQQFTAAQIAAALGKSARVVRRWLGTVKPDGETLVRGNISAAWRVDSLPECVKLELSSAKRRRGIASIEEMVGGKIKAYEPKIPWGEICPEQQAEAIKLQRALSPALEHWKEISASPSGRDYAWREDATLLSLGLRIYQEELGARVTAERWQYLFHRVLERDGGAAQFNRPELFLSGNVRRSVSTEQSASDHEFRELWHVIFKKCTNPQSPSWYERGTIWQCVYRTLQPFSGRELKRTRLHLIKYLVSSAPWLAASPNAMRMSVNRFYAIGNAKDDAIENFLDGREKRRGIPTVQPYDREQIALVKITATALTDCSRANAVRRLDKAGMITDTRIKGFLARSTSKSHTPASFRAEMKDLPAWQMIHIGPKSAEKLRPTNKLVYDGIASNCCLVPDDKTPDVYIAVWNQNEGWWVPMRPQLIPFADFRSTMITARAIVPAPQFAAIDVRGGFIKAFTKFGMPRFIMREGGKIFRGSNLVNSLADIGTPRTRDANGKMLSEKNPFSVAEIEAGLERFGGTKFGEDVERFANQLGETGIKFREAYRANAKPVEGVIRLLDREIRLLPCYCGTDERRNCPESTTRAVMDVRARRKTPEEVGMLVWDQWIFAVDKCIDEYNNTPQEGERLRHPLTGRPMTPAEAYNLFQDKDNPPNPFSPECAAFLASEKLEVMVKTPSLRRRQSPCGFVEIKGNTYCDEQTGARIGQKLLAFYNPEVPEVCTFSDMNFRNHFTVGRLEPINALFPNQQTGISLAQAQRTVSGVKADYRAAATKFLPLVRKAIVAPYIKNLNQQIEKGTAEVREKQRRKTDRASTISRKARGTGFQVGQVENSERSLSALELIQKSKDERVREIEKEKSK